MDYKTIYKENPFGKGIDEYKKIVVDCRRSKRLETFNRNRTNFDAITKQINEQGMENY